MKDLEFIGIGGAYNLELGGNCAFLKEKNTLLLIDCCEDATTKLNKKGAFNNITEIIVAITHTHADHVAGLGTFLWYTNFILNIKPKIVSNSPTFQTHLTQLLTLLGVDSKFYEFIEPQKVNINGLTLEAQKTTHTEKLECYGIEFCDFAGKYYYSGDTNEIEKIKGLVLNPNVKKVYCEASHESYGVHISYNDLKQIKSQKLTLMHFETLELYNTAIKDGFCVAKI